MCSRFPLTLSNNLNFSTRVDSLSKEQKEFICWRHHQLQHFLRNYYFTSMLVPSINSYNQQLGYYESQTPFKTEPIEDESRSLSLTKSESDVSQIEFNIPLNPYFIKKEECALEYSSNQLQTCIQNILDFLLENLQIARQEEILHYRNLYIYDVSLLEIFDAIVEKYSSCAKGREDMVRHVLRKVLTYSAKCLKTREKTTLKVASGRLCRKYLQDNQTLLKSGVNLDDESQVMNLLLPYKKNSRFKTANMDFIQEIFSSQEFYNDYIEFLGMFDAILESDSTQRKKKFVKFLVQCVKEKTLFKLKSFHRIPWLKHWNESTKIIANDLLHVRRI